MTTTDPRLIDSLLELGIPPRRVYAGRHRLGPVPGPVLSWDEVVTVLARTRVTDAVDRRRRDRRATRRRSWRHW